jgi:hypothetical protein
MPYDAYLSCGKIHDVHGTAELCGEGGVVYALDRDMLIINPYII